MSALGRRLGKLEASRPALLSKAAAQWLGMVPHPDAPDECSPSDVPLSPEALEWLNAPGRGLLPK